MMLRQPLVKTDSWLCCSQGRFATGRIFDVLGKVHDLGPYNAGNVVGVAASGTKISDPWPSVLGPPCTSINQSTHNPEGCLCLRSDQ